MTATRLEHVNLVVPELGPTLDFLRVAFPQWRVRGEGTNEWFGRPRRWLHFGDDNFYVTLNDGGEGPARDLDGHAPGLAHIGFVVEDSDAVRDRLIAHGHEVHMHGGDHPFRKTVYFVDPAGIEFEFMQYLSDAPEEKNLYDGETSATRQVEAG